VFNEAIAQFVLLDRRHGMFGPLLLNAVHCGIVEQPGTAGSTLVVPKSLDCQSVR
jgi:hypothetical protein